MQLNAQNCEAELSACGIIPRKYYGQVFTVDLGVINKLIETIKSIYRPGTKIVEIGGGLGYITKRLAQEFDDIDCLEIDEAMIDILNKKFIQQKNVRILSQDILTYPLPQKDYLLVGNIPFHTSGKLYRRFMSDVEHKPYGMVFITDKQYARTLQGQPPRCYRVSLQAQAYGTIEIVADVPASACTPEPKVETCIMKITHAPTPLPQNFWKVVNHQFENFPTREVESPKMVSLKDWIAICNKK